MTEKSVDSLKSQDNIGHTRKAYLGIRNMLFHNELGPDQKISYRDLAERLGMSQTPVIQALKWLEFQQLVRHEPNRGYYTAPVSMQEVAEIYDLRELIELALLPKTLDRLDPKGLGTLQASLVAHKNVAGGIYLYDRLRKDMDFHLHLASLSGCLVQQQTLQNLFDLLYLKYGGSLLFSTSMESAHADHAELVAYVKEKDLKNAKRVLARHIRQVKKHVLAGLEQLLKAKKTTGI